MKKNEMNIKLGQKAKALIPGGAHTYSKGDDQFPENAPKIITHGKGCHIWDVDGNKYIDFAMSLGSVLIGHAYEPVLRAVREEIEKGANFTRPAMIEAEVAEMLNDIIPCADMVKFAKNGSDAVTAAVKLARAYTGRDYIARCSTDAFNAIHDWFIGSTVMNRGVPECVQKLTLKFNYNDIKSCEALFAQHPGQIAAFLLEPVSGVAPENNFLQELKNLCEKNGALLIFDEVVSGFRFSLGGAQEYAKVTPHLGAFGKGMANGFAISALVGQREFMRLGEIDGDHERVFLLSTTHGGETHALAAAKATITEMKNKNLVPQFWKAGEALQNGIRKAAKDVGAEKYIDVMGFGCKPGFAYRDETGEVSMVARTLFLQETTERGLLIPAVAPGFSHTPEIIDEAVGIIRESLAVMKKAAEGAGMKAAVRGNIVKPVFRKFN